MKFVAVMIDFVKQQATVGGETMSLQDYHKREREDHQKRADAAKVFSAIAKQSRCPLCNSCLYTSGTEVTLVGYSSPAGHDHDDNCQQRVYWCDEGHRWFVSKRNRCGSCDWTGKDLCFCHTGEKQDHWPEEGDCRLYALGETRELIEDGGGQE